MSKQTIAIIDYDSGNIHSVQKALEQVAPDAHIIHSADKNLINQADKIVFPGQGAIGTCMQKLKQRDLINTIKTNADDKPFLGICLGLQLLFDKSEEDSSEGLGIIAGNVIKFDNQLKVPHMGWNSVKQSSHPLWHQIPDNSYFYSVHSYFVRSNNQNIVTGTTHYGIDFTCAIAKDNLFATQFHPEKSDKHGLQLLKNFVNL